MSTITVDSYPRVIEWKPTKVKVTASPPRVLSRSAPLATVGGFNCDQLVIVEAVTENPLMELRGAVVEAPSWVLNGIGTLRFTISAHDGALVDCLVDPDTLDLGSAEQVGIGREVQWWRNGELRWAGVPVRGDVDLGSQTVTYDCPDLGWYLSRRFMGAAERKDLLDGIGQMEKVGLPGWTRTGAAVAVRNTTTKQRGVGAAQVSGVGSLQASFIHPAQTEGQDGTVYLTAMVRIPDTYSAEDYLCSITAVPSDGSDVYRPGDYNTATVLSDTASGSWVRVGCYCYMRPGRQNVVTVTLWSLGGGNIYFDDVRAQKNDTTGIPVPGADKATHGVAIVNHAQDGRGKGTFGFKAEVLTPSGTTEVLGERHQLHTQVLDVFKRYVDSDDGWDWWIDPQRRAIVFAARKGKDQTNLPLSERTIAAGGWTHDETNKSSSIVVLGEGDGVERPEGSYVDTSTTAGLVLEELVRPPNGTRLGDLDPMARARWAQASQPQTTFRPIKVPATWWEEYDLQTGDTLPSDLHCGVLRPSLPSDGLRVQRITHDLSTDTLELV